MRTHHLLVLFCALAVIAICAGCAETPPITPTPTSPPITVTTAVPVGTIGTSLTPGPTQALPGGKEISFQVRRDQIQPTIVVVFRGGAGQNQVRSMQVTLVRSDGQVSTQSLAPNVGSEAVFTGTRGKDRVVIDATYTTSETFRVMDEVYDFYSHT